MANKAGLRILRAGMVINATSSRQEKALAKAITRVAQDLVQKFPGLMLKLEAQWLLKNVVERLRSQFPEIDFQYIHSTSSMRPDGGILSVATKDNRLFPILITEKKNQGTNEQRALEGKNKQAKGNAIERLGKNVIGFRTAFKAEAIFPFICFGDGCDFSDDSSILDRVGTIAMFGCLNREYVHKEGGAAEFDRGSFFFRVAEWTEDEMHAVALSVAVKSVYYYYSKYGEEAFV